MHHAKKDKIDDTTLIFLVGNLGWRAMPQSNWEKWSTSRSLGRFPLIGVGVRARVAKICPLRSYAAATFSSVLFVFGVLEMPVVKNGKTDSHLIPSSQSFELY